MNTPPNNDEFAYSGSSRPGLTVNGSYDRVIWNGEKDAFTSTNDVADLVADCMKTFGDVASTRLMIRTKLSGDADTTSLPGLLHNVGIEEHSIYFDQHEQAHKIFAATNSPERRMHHNDVNVIQQHITERVLRSAHVVETPATFREHALAEHSSILNKGMRLCNKATADEMFELWGHPFGWSKKQCMQQASHLSSRERVYVLRNGEGKVISGVYVSDGETTEWATLPEHQGEGLIVPLLIYSHCNLINEDICSVFAEARWNRSVSASIKSGLRIPKQTASQWALTNHVSIGDNPEYDPPDPWNTQRTTLRDNTEGSMLRSFAVAHLDTDLYTDDVLATYLS